MIAELSWQIIDPRQDVLHVERAQLKLGHIEIMQQLVEFHVRDTEANRGVCEVA